MFSGPIPRVMNFNLGQTTRNWVMPQVEEITAWKNKLAPFVGTPQMPEVICFQNIYLGRDGILQAACAELGLPYYASSVIYQNCTISIASKYMLNNPFYRYLTGSARETAAMAVTIIHPATYKQWVIFNFAMSQGVADPNSYTPFFRGGDLRTIATLADRISGYGPWIQMAMQRQYNVLIGADLNIPRSQPALMNQAIKSISLKLMGQEYGIKDSYMLNSTTTPAMSNQHSSDYILAPAELIPAWPTNGFSTMTHTFDGMPWDEEARYQYPIWDNLIR